jgi:peptide/nickel transport system permease protein
MFMAMVLRRSAQGLVVLFLLLTSLFFIARLTGDPITMLAGGVMSSKDIEVLREAYGLNEPIYYQYWLFLKGAVQLDFGESIQTRQAATGMVLSRLWATLQLAIPALVAAVSIGVVLGTIAAIRRGAIGYLAMFMAVIGQSVPSFFLGVMLILVFGVWLNWLPVFGRGGLDHLLLPTVTLMGYPLARYTRLVRAQVSEAMTLDYVRTARAKGLHERKVVADHVLRNALLPVVSVIGVDIGTLLATAVIVEAIFAWPGFGSLLIQSAMGRDYPVLQASIAAIGVTVIVSSIIVDFLYGILDPRIRTAS